MTRRREARPPMPARPALLVALSFALAAVAGCSAGEGGGRRRVYVGPSGAAADELPASAGTADPARPPAPFEPGVDTSALDTMPPEPWGERLRALRQELRARRVETEVLRVDARGVVEYVPFGSDVDLVVRLRNVGTADVLVAPPSGSGADALSGSTLALSIVRRDRDVYAAELVRSWTQSVPIVGEGSPGVSIPPEGSYEVRVRVPAS